MGLLDRLRNRPVNTSVKELISKGIDLADQPILDKDKLIELQHTLAMVQTQLMLSGKGQSFTKIIINLLVSVVVLIGAYAFIRGFEYIFAAGFTRESIEMAKIFMSNYRDFAFPAGTIIGLITGGFLTGTSFKRSKWSKEE